MRTTLLHRLEKLETRTESEELPFVRYGWVKMLPQEFSGERHVVILKREPTGSARAQWCEFAERTGPAPTDGTGYYSGAISRSDLGYPGQSQSPPPDPGAHA